MVTNISVHYNEKIGKEANESTKPGLYHPFIKKVIKWLITVCQNNDNMFIFHDNKKKLMNSWNSSINQ